MRTFSFLSLLSLLLALFLANGPALAQAPKDAAPTGVVTWRVDKAHSKIGFKVKHLGISTVRGDFGAYDAVVKLDPSNLSTLQADATVEVQSIDTRIEKRDNHLRSADFFAADEYPQMTFVSKKVRNVEGNRFELVGDLTIRGTTKEVVFDGAVLGVAAMGGTQRAGIEAETTINRHDFGLSWNKLTEAGGFVVSPDVTIVLELETIAQ